MSTSSIGLRQRLANIIWPAVFATGAIAAYFTYPMWMPHAHAFLAFVKNQKEIAAEPESVVPRETPDTLTLSPMAWKNIGLVVGSVTPSDFVKIVSVPAIVVERPGRSQIQIAAPMTGIVTQVYPLEREGIKPGEKLFDLRLTHEDVVAAQSNFLSQLQTLDAATQELERLQGIGEGVIPGKRIIEQQYIRDKAVASIAATRQSLLLHGMTDDQIEEIESSRKLLRDITVTAPPYAENHEHADVVHQYHVQSVNVSRGESVTAGDLLGVLADHCLLYVEGKAFEDDANRLIRASSQGQSSSGCPCFK